MIIEFDEKYNEDIKDLLLELQEHIAALDDEKFNIVTPNYREEYYVKTMNEIKEKNGKMFLYKDNDDIVGLVVGIINNEKEEEVGFRAPKRGRITELIVGGKTRSKGIGSKLLKSMEDYLYNQGCQKVLLCVLTNNVRAKNFYDKHGYHSRVIDMIK